MISTRPPSQANLALTTAFNAYLRSVPLSTLHDGNITDSLPMELRWSVPGSMPYGLNEGVTCWFSAAPGHPEGPVLNAGGLWPTGVAHTSRTHSVLNRSFVYDPSSGLWDAVPPPPFTPGRTQGACLQQHRALLNESYSPVATVAPWAHG